MTEQPSAKDRFRQMMAATTPVEQAADTGPEPASTPAAHLFGPELWAAVEVIRARGFWSDLDVWQDPYRATIEVDPQDGKGRIRVVFKRVEGMSESAECFLGTEPIQRSASPINWAEDGPYAYLTYWLDRLLPPRR